MTGAASLRYFCTLFGRKDRKECCFMIVCFDPDHNTLMGGTEIRMKN